ncbi:MAG TPA: hypothetical protein VMM54_02715 [Nitrospirota bacterium]|nr:hypothetical protein [Nitrospirota bacterium]
MKHVIGKFRSLVMILAAFLLLNSCMAGKRLDIKGTVPADIQGTYALLLYGCKYGNDLENLAILYRDEGPFTFDIYSLPTSYRVIKGLSADEALKQADKFLRCSTDYWKTQLSKIVDREGTIAGYELRPLYAPYQYGHMDVLDISYWLRDSKVTVYIKLDTDTQKSIENNGSPFDSGK